MADQYTDRLKTLGARVQERRKALGMSQRELASLSKLHYNYISGIERGERNPTIIILWKICDVLGCELTDLMKS